MELTIAQDNARIIQLPVEDPPDLEWAKAWAEGVLLPTAPRNANGTPFMPHIVQAWCLSTYARLGGFLAPVAVGGGKTMISLVVPEIGFRYRGHKKALLLIPNDLISQLKQRDIEWVGKRMPLSYPISWIAGKTKAERIRIANTDRPGLYIMAYSQLSNRDGLEVLRAIAPTLIVADEAHSLAKVNSGRSKKLWGVLSEVRESGANVECGFMSGTMTRKDLEDFQRLVVQALGVGAPVPILANNVQEWNAELFSSAAYEHRERSAGYLEFLRQWAVQDDPEGDYPVNVVGRRRAFQRRLRRTPGVVYSDTDSCSSELVIHLERVSPTQSMELETAMAILLSDGMRPDGEMVPTPMHIFHTAFELSSGFYNYLEWPETDDEDLLRRSMIYLDACRAWTSATDEWCPRLPLGYDTPEEVAEKISQSTREEDPIPLPKDFPAGLVMAHLDKEEAFAPDLLYRMEKHRWLDEWKMEYVVDKVLKQKEPALVWAFHIAVQEKLKELFRKRGVEPLSVEDAQEPERVGKGDVCVLSATANSTGLNLQHFHKSYYAQALRNATQIEQSLGRTHRFGQEADRVEAWIFLGMEYEDSILGAGLLDSTYVHQILGNRQKAVISSWDPLPRLPPPAMIYERIGDIASEASEAADEYASRFGS